MARPISYRQLTLFFLGWCAFLMVLHALALEYTFGFGWKVSFIDAGVTSALIALGGFEMNLMMRYYQPRHILRFVMSIGLALLCLFAIQHLIALFVDGPVAYGVFLEKSIFIRGLFVWLMIALISVLTWLWLSVKEHQEVEARNATMQQLAREAELSRLRQQLQPHFLFNSLNSISALAGSRPEEARKMIHQLSDFFRGTLKKDQQIVPFSEELEHLTLYLDIEKVRFGHRLKTNIRVDDAALALELPALLLQPVVENAIKFGLYDTTGETVISIYSNKEDKFLRIRVDNPFDPSSAPPRRGTGFGLDSIRRRLYLLYARNDLLTTSQKDNTFTTTIRIPQSV